VVSTWRADGALGEQRIVNRDGSLIHSKFAAPTDRVSWDERHTVTTTSGAHVRIENAGDR
jgi:hypothetical protein